MAEFTPAVVLVMQNEGGFIDHPSDPGGATNFGISLRFLRSLSGDALRKYGFFDELTKDAIRNMTEDQAIAIYFNEFWNKLPYTKIADQAVANYLFDMAVNHGQKRAVIILQRALWAAYRKRGIVADDGVFGERTLGAIGTVAPYLVGCMMAERAGFYRSLDKPQFLDGWLNRAYHF
jgi:lysozyme family protein